ncbi:hypothetical protein [Nocardiopsis ganjiahuensis]|uniref:hypothetical protein n=1 Tax=Nocardiopsis ganjiahuensis TaxID=239984 RepID=UPI00034C2F95|nr:hypothetical protein [Nocardiopsis ganjiahuensis]
MGPSVDEVLDWLSQQTVEGLLVPGYVNRDEHPATHLRNRWVYLSTAAGPYLCAHQPLDDVVVRLSVVDSVSDAERDVTEFLDEGEEFTLVHLTDLYFPALESAGPLTGARYYLDPRSDPGKGTVAALELSLGAYTTLFLDPLTWGGLELGRRGDFERWYANRFSVHQRHLREVRWAP